MRAVNGFLAVMFALFAVVQYNDPQPALWFLIYGVPAAFCGLAAWRPDVLASRPALQAGLGACLVAAAIGAIVWWPYEYQEWWDRADIREGMGLIIITLALAFVAVSVWRTRQGPGGRRPQRAAARSG
jgi:peptidoglycan/LPS O-acetylase OafA/YrhL